MTVFLYTFTERETPLQLLRAPHRRALHHVLHAHRRRLPRRRATTGSARSVSSATASTRRSTRGSACSRTTASGASATRASASSRARWPSATASRARWLRGSRRRLRRAARTVPYAGYENVRLRRPRSASTATATTATWSASRRCASRPASSSRRSTPSREGPVPRRRAQVRPAPQAGRDDRHGGADPPVHARSPARWTTPKGEIHSHSENPKGEAGYIIRSEGGAAPWRLKYRAPLVRQPASPEGHRPGPSPGRHRRHPGIDRLRDGRVRQVSASPSSTNGAPAAPTPVEFPPKELKKECEELRLALPRRAMAAALPDPAPRPGALRRLGEPRGRGGRRGVPRRLATPTSAGC